MTMVVVVPILLLASGCSDDDDSSSGGGGDSSNLSITSTNFNEGGAIPTNNISNVCSGGNQSPQLSWTNAPSNTVEFAIVMDDESTPGCNTGINACVHWGLFNIKSSTTSLIENATINPPMTESQNGAIGKDYEGPCPPSTHIYKFTVYALSSDITPDMDAMWTRASFSSTYSGQIVDSATLSGTYTP